MTGNSRSALFRQKNVFAETFFQRSTFVVVGTFYWNRFGQGESERRFVICAQNMIVVVDQKYSLALQVCQRFFSILLVRDFQHQPIKFVSQNLQD